MKIIKEYSRTIIHLIDIHHARFTEYDKLNRETNIKNNMKPIVLLTVSWYLKTEGSVEYILSFSDNYEIIILANTIEEHKFYCDNFKNECLFINQNAFTHETAFFIEENVEKKYDLFVNSAFCNYKRLEFTKLINNVVYLGRYPEYYDVKNINLNENVSFLNFKDNIVTKENHRWVFDEEINKISNESLMGGIFSDTEGACFSSSQYLLCGLPVISTKCKGGREVWYNEKNMIYCDDTPESVLKCVENVKNNLDKNLYNKYEIRKAHIELQEKFRTALTNNIIEKLKLNDNIYINFEILKKDLSYFVY